MRTSRTQQVAEAVVRLIYEGDLPDGAPLPTEEDLTHRLDISRGPLREALKALQALGIVEVRHGYGTFVGPGNADALLPWAMFRTRPRRAQDWSGLRDLLAVRESIEVDLTRNLARHGADPDTIAQLRECLARMEQDSLDAPDADQRFHEIICEAARNPLAADLIKLFWTVYQAAVEHHLSPPSDNESPLSECHLPILLALEARDPDAAEKAVRRHFDELGSRTSDSLPVDRSPTSFQSEAEATPSARCGVRLGQLPPSGYQHVEAGDTPIPANT